MAYPRDNAPPAQQRKPPPVLVILDMNGVLVHRSKGNPQAGESRPHLESFLYALFEELRGEVIVGVWSSMMEHNLWPLVQQAFGHYTRRLCFVYDQSWCTQRRVPGMHKPLLRKDLWWLQQTAYHRHVPYRVLLIDDDPIKCTENEPGSAVHPCSFEGTANMEEEDVELLRLAEYIRTLVNSGCSKVPEYVLANPFEDFQLPTEGGEAEADLQEEVQEVEGPEAHDGVYEDGEADEEPEKPPPAKRARTSQQEDAELLEPGAAVEAFWPEDESWLSAQVVECLAGSDQVVIVWQEDGSESEVSREYLRRAEAPQRRRKAPASEGPWQRMESRGKPGKYYYYNSDDGDVKVQPPPPWETRELSTAGKYYYYNTETGELAFRKPEL